MYATSVTALTSGCNICTDNIWRFGRRKWEMVSLAGLMHLVTVVDKKMALLVEYLCAW